MLHDRGRPRLGDVVSFTLAADGDAEPHCRAEYRIESAPDRSRTADPLAASRTYRTRLLTERWSAAAGATPRPGPGTAPAELARHGLVVNRPRWDFIRDNRPVVELGATTSAITAGSAVRDYTGAREGASKVWEVRVADAIDPSTEYIRVRFRLEGAYFAMPAHPGLTRGHYLTRLDFSVLECMASWPTWVEAVGQVDQLEDRGTRSNRIPEVIVQARFSWGWIGCAHRHACAFRANGLTGFEPLPAHTLHPPFARE